jgi:O-antigen ligase
LLAGLAFVASATALLASAERLCFNESQEMRSGFCWPVLLAALMAILGLVGLARSYSRGAWTGVIIALSMLAMIRRRAIGMVLTRIGLGKCIGLSCALAAAGIALAIAVGGRQATDSLIVRRAFSVANPNDLSWRYRVAAWEGALQMMADHPFCGLGWNGVEWRYIEFYQSAPVPESGAIHTNDFFMLGTTLGLPGLAAFLAFVALRWRPEATKGESPNWLQAGRHACLLVLLTGMFLDGVLQNLPVESAFWALLGLGSAGSRPHRGPTPMNENPG